MCPSEGKRGFILCAHICSILHPPTKRVRENSLFDTMLKCGSLFDTEPLFLPYMILCLKFVPYMTLHPILQLTVLNDT
jgi:hypothetical protein